MQDEVKQFVESLAIPEERRAVVLAELVDHVASTIEAAVRAGRDPDAAAREVLGELEAMRPALEAIEPAFQVTRWQALARGVLAGAVVAILLDQGGELVYGVVGAVLVL